MDDFKQMLASLTHSFITLSQNHLALLESHFQLLLEWNRKMNLTRITELGEAVRRHYGESLFLAANLPAGPLRVVDIGSGPGFPGFVVAVVRPDCHVTLLEAVRKKGVFMEEASRSFSNITVLVKRAEKLPADSHDWMISRAVAWREIEPLKVARRIAILASLPDREEIRPGCAWSWNAPLPIPWDDRRVLLIGRSFSGFNG
jgi:16S rRNA (guanine(527)-N(7))-methyltransferase RsmG